MPLCFVTDEDVPESIGEFLRARGHQVLRAIELAGRQGVEDHVLAALANENDAIVVTWNRKDFRQVISRRKKGGEKLRNAGLITFHRVKETLGLARVQQVVDTIEFEYERSQSRHDQRLFVVIARDWFKVER